VQYFIGLQGYLSIKTCLFDAFFVFGFFEELLFMDRELRHEVSRFCEISTKTHAPVSSFIQSRLAVPTCRNFITTTLTYRLGAE
jgi:hypothetical protein